MCESHGGALASCALLSHVRECARLGPMLPTSWETRAGVVAASSNSSSRPSHCSRRQSCANSSFCSNSSEMQWEDPLGTYIAASGALLERDGSMREAASDAFQRAERKTASTGSERAQEGRKEGGRVPKSSPK